jgi:hypothetical protein
MRMNISVPDDLAEQVRARDLPISSICQDALRKAVELAEKKEQIMTNIEAVVERLRGTQDEEKQRQNEEGRVLGILWAKQWATADELETAAGMDVDAFPGWATSTDSIREFMDEVEHNFKQEYADDHNEGFLDGASEVWDAVKDQL